MERSAAVDVAGAAVLTVAAQVELAASGVAHPVAASLSTLLLTGSLAGRRRAPAACGLVALGVFVAQQAFVGDVEHASAVAVLSLAVALYSLGAYAEPRRSKVVGGVFVVALWVLALVKHKSIGDAVFVSVVMFGPLLAGMARHRSAQRQRVLEDHVVAAARAGARHAERAVEEERERIARELHDVVAHAMSVIVVQAGAERRVLDEEHRSTREVLETIERTAREALGEMRRLVGMMREGDDALGRLPQPSVRLLPDLCDQMRAAGLPVELEISGDERDLPPGVDISAYRIVQESLTNALKHAGPTRVQVRVRYGDDDLGVEVVDDGRGPLDGSRAGPGARGFGLAGMRERVDVYGGDLVAGGRDTGGYAVRARLPLGQA